MCLAIPMQVVSVDGTRGVVETRGVRYDVRLDLIEDPAPGIWVLVHAGFAIQQLDEDAARETLALFDEIDGLAGDPGTEP